ncbi:MAG: SUMF1/EgtB/PvdO family nonheme iron enzyme [Anaerolineae bacterium]|nr:SUMF1/EgtB/PvdO family nonheme iron enzyme [Anaerolineae bacterium]
MKLFISYARVDKPVCTQIVEMLEVHEVWYDHRLHAGQKWWEEILRHLTWCDGFVYLLSRESVASEYCKQEFEIAQSLGKHIFPVLIHGGTTIPDALREIQHADFSSGLDVRAVKQLLSAIYVAEKLPLAVAAGAMPAVTLPPQAARAPEVDTSTVIDEAAEALDNGDFDKAVFLLKRARETGYEPRFIDLKAVLQEAEIALERQAYLREAEREYRPIVALIKRQRTFQLGCKAFQSFRQSFPDYDPDGLAAVATSHLLPLPDWCSIKAGEVVIERDKRRIIYHLDAYKMSKYPVTNQQFQAFVTAVDGYSNPKWWESTPEMCEWHKQHPEPLDSKFAGDDYPRVNVCYFEAVAYCAWLSDKSGMKITLPTEQQWQRAAQGDSEYRYPWGNHFDKTRCNTQEAAIRMTTPVNKYPLGASPYGVMDMAGNIWEWTQTNQMSQKANGSSPAPHLTYIVKGGSYMGSQERARNTFYFKLDPVYRYHTIGFRVVMG